MLFMKPTSSYLANGGTIQIPHPWESLDHEVELAVVIGQKARDVAESTAMDYVGGTEDLSLKSLFEVQLFTLMREGLSFDPCEVGSWLIN